MEETVVTKRPRDASQVEEEEQKVDSHEEQCKRHKPYNHILSLLESEEEEPTEDLSSLITTLQQEITCSASHSETHLSPLQENNRDNYPTTAAAATAEEDDKERVMRHLLQASDDELGIPNAGDGLWDFGEEGFMNGGDNGLGYVCEGLWELEDETANYYALLQSELFL